MRLAVVFLALTGFGNATGGEVRATTASAGTRVVLGGSLRAVALAGTTASAQQPVIVPSVLKEADLAQVISFEIGLPVRDLATLQQRVAVTHRLPSGELETAHLPSKADFAAIERWMTDQGFVVTKRDQHRLAIFAQGTVAQIQSAFQTRFAQVSFEGKTHLAAVTAPSVPAGLPAILGVVGLQPFGHARAERVDSAKVAGPETRAVGQPATNNAPPYTVSEIRGAYNASAVTLNGDGQTIGIVSDALPSSSDLTSFWTANNVSQSTDNVGLENDQVTSDAPDSRSGGETLIGEWTGALAPSAQLYYYVTGTLEQADLDSAYSEIGEELGDGDQEGLQQLCLSFVADENSLSSSELTMDEQYFATIASYGVSIFAPAGDNGAFYKTGSVGVQYPASDPSVTGVGGTSLILNSSGGVSSETAWSATGTALANGAIGASGGGLSAISRPNWQTGTGVPGGSTRCVPDVAAAADPNEAGMLIYNGVTSAGAFGTTFAAATWAGFAALFNESRANAGAGPLGALNPQIYPLDGKSSFRDITSGRNGHYQQTDGYSAGTGYDLVTGLGAPNVANLLGAFGGGAPTITSFSPSAGPVGSTVVIKGTNFIPPLSITFGGNVQAEGNFTTTQITATVPSGAHTGLIKVTTANGTAMTATNFTVGAVAKPNITSAPTASGYEGAAFSYTITADAAVQMYGASNLPAGLVVDETSGVISGTPTVTGEFTVALTAMNSSGTGMANLDLTINTESTELVAALSVTKDELASGKYKIKGMFTLTNDGNFKAKHIPLGAYLSTTSTVAVPVTTGADLEALSLELTTTDASGNPLPVPILSLVAGTGDPVILPGKLGKMGTATASTSYMLNLKLSAASLTTGGGGQYQYVVLVADPNNTISETSKTNNTGAVNLQAAVVK